MMHGRHAAHFCSSQAALGARMWHAEQSAVACAAHATLPRFFNSMLPAAVALQCLCASSGQAALLAAEAGMQEGMRIERRQRGQQAARRRAASWKLISTTPILPCCAAHNRDQLL